MASTNLSIPQRGSIIVSDYKIEPFQINPKLITKNVFEDPEMETVETARLVIKWAARHRKWQPFSKPEIDDFLIEICTRSRNHGGIVHFGTLVEPRLKATDNGFKPHGGGWLVLNGSKYHFTTGFVDICHQATTQKPA